MERNLSKNWRVTVFGTNSKKLSYRLNAPPSEMAKEKEDFFAFADLWEGSEPLIWGCCEKSKCHPSMRKKELFL